MNELRKRPFAAEVEVRAEEGKTPQLVGLVRVNVRSVDLGGFREMLMPGCFDAVLDNDVRALKNHDDNMILGRTKSGTLRMKVDGSGNLGYVVDLPDTTAGRDIQVEVKRGDIDGTSFAFRVAPDGEKWIEEADGTILRQITNFMLLRDLSPVVYPAYPDDEVCLRSEYDAYKEKNKEPEAESHSDQVIDEMNEDPGENTDDDLGTIRQRMRLIEIETAL